MYYSVFFSYVCTHVCRTLLSRARTHAHTDTETHKEGEEEKTVKVTSFQGQAIPKGQYLVIRPSMSDPVAWASVSMPWSLFPWYLTHIAFSDIIPFSS